MPYTPTQDGAQAFAIPASPLTINSVTYIAEDIDIQNPTTIPELKDANGIPIGQALIPQNPKGTMTLQLATSGTAVPPKASIFTLFGASYYVADVGTSYKQGEYTKVKVSFVGKIN